MADICLVTLNSTYQHTAFGLRYLFANLKDLKSRAQILEFTIHRAAAEIVDQIIALEPKIVGFGVYIWNTSQTKAVVELLKQKAPQILVVLGGPEVSYETESQKICQLADYVICGEADHLFYNFCHQILDLKLQPQKKIIAGPLPDISKIENPYSLYSDHDIVNRIIYVEASRGCPYKCEYCLSSLDKSVRNFPIDQFLTELELLISRGARQFKFIDRTFNLSPSISTRILQFFLDRIDLGLFLHFEMVPDRLPVELRALIEKFPAGSLQFEIGIQTWNQEVAALVSRRQDFVKVKENLIYLREKTGVHTHVDLIAGLPGETLESFATGFDQLAQLRPDEIQVGILKRLKGTPIIRHEKNWMMIYSEEQPFQILENKNLGADILLKMQKFSKFWDLIANSGNFKNTMELILLENQEKSLFWWFWDLTEFLAVRHPQGHSIHLLHLFESMLDYLTNELHWDVKHLLEADYSRGRPGPTPKFLRSEQSSAKTSSRNPGRNPDRPLSQINREPSLPLRTPKRQQLHLRS